MTQCYKGGHEFPIEDEYGCYCEEHGVSAIWKHPHPTEPLPHPLMAQRDPDNEQARAT